MVKTVFSFQFLCSKLQLLIIKILYVLPTPHFQIRLTYADPSSTNDFRIKTIYGGIATMCTPTKCCSFTKLYICVYRIYLKAFL